MSAMALGNDQINDVVARLKGLSSNLDREQKSEDEHKEWCEGENSKTTNKRTGHAMEVEKLQQSINSLSELIGMKANELENNQDDIDAETQAWNDALKMRQNDKERYEEDLKDTTDAIQALNQAIDILSKFYASKKSSLIQTAKAQTFTKAHNGGGQQVIAEIAKTRGEFEDSAKFLRDTEAAAVTSHETSRQAHIQADTDLQQNRNVITVEKQTAEQALSSNRDDLTSNQGEIVAANSYLLRLGGSCQPLIDNYASRKNLRSEEKSSIKEAIKVLQDA